MRGGTVNISIDEEKKAITIKRNFNGTLEKIWKAWTDPEVLDQWWAPKPWKIKTQSMDFKEGGHWLYTMVGPDGSEHWSRTDFISIEPGKCFSGHDAFCDENGVIKKEYPRSFWTNQFIEYPGFTSVSILIVFDELSDLEKIIEMGFQEGISASMENLDELKL